MAEFFAKIYVSETYGQMLVHKNPDENGDRSVRILVDLAFMDEDLWLGGSVQTFAGEKAKEACDKEFDSIDKEKAEKLIAEAISHVQDHMEKIGANE